MDLYAAYNVVVYCYHNNVLCGAVTGGGGGGWLEWLMTLASPQL